ncbi:SRPBCC family protein [Amycolatopsis cynarae]|uniref:SRPBCC family protein n=1 Tax=Amycolatopsis cynarae TaxID=2995223 RepID=A0ABY7AT95_9PSEU|nr:SRPBCC family protein [Amycolatopsis sp. HUAS 11-8]WAL63176.1 SRPBCC family protein [Amycolatopsis sp. HUAS 11-8]
MSSEVLPDATGRIAVSASAERVYELVSDPGALAGCAEEYSGYRWLGGATSAGVGARFRGTNKRGLRRWNTVSTITDAVPGKRFAFEVSSFGIPVSRWQYDLEPDGDGCVVVESTWDRRPAWFRSPSSLVTGVWQRADHNRANIEATLRRLKSAAER